MPNPYGRIKTSKITHFPFTEDEKEILQGAPEIKVKVPKGHGAPTVCVGKEFFTNLYGGARQPITVKVKKVSKDGAVVTLERKREK